MRNIITAILAFMIIISCNKEDEIDYDTGLRLNFSTDSILFDTVFTQIGTTTRVLKVFNYNKKAVIISEIKLKGGDASDFKININGTSSSNIKDFKLAGNDSAYVFVKAQITPDNQQKPFIVSDEIEFTLNGNLQKIPVEAYGQNAIYLRSKDITTDITYTK